MSSPDDERFHSFAEFYPYYLQEHSNAVCRRLHYVGSLLVLAVLFHAVASQQWLWLLALPLVGYGFAWVGHFVFEKNRPATFKYPLWSFMGDWVMLRTLSPAASASDPSARLAPGRSLPGRPSVPDRRAFLNYRSAVTGRRANAWLRFRQQPGHPPFPRRKAHEAEPGRKYTGILSSA